MHIKGTFNSNAFLVQLFFERLILMPFGTVIFGYLGSHFTEKERNRWRNFSPALKCNLVDCIEISGNRCANTKHSLTKIETSYLVALFNGSNFRFVNYKY